MFLPQEIVVRIISYLLVLIIIFIGVTFAILNSETVAVNYYFDRSTIPLSLIIVIAFAIGCLIGMFIGLCFVIKAKMRNYRLHQRLSLAEKEIENLRAIPLQDKV